VSQADEWISAEFNSLAEIINDYDHHLFLEWVPPAQQQELTDKSKVFRVIDDRNNKIVLYADSLSNPQEILTRLWSMDSVRGNVLSRMDARNAAIEALRLKERLDAMEEAKDFSVFVLGNEKNYWVHEGRKRDADFNDLGPVRRVID
jgi:hypothetical protein